MAIFYCQFLLVLLVCSQVAFGASKYYIGEQGKSCYETCYVNGMNCNPHIDTGNSVNIFNQLGIQCTADPRPWWAEDQPSYVSDPSDPNYKKCLGFTKVPDGVVCGASFKAVRRLCNCDDPSDASSVAAFGTGLSNGELTTSEQDIFSWILPSGVSHGVMTHFWATAGPRVLDNALVRYYIDGEATASIQFFPPLACGTFIGEKAAPWGTTWFGKGAADGAWFNNFRIPFQKSVRVTIQDTVGDFGGFYMIVRGAPALPINIGGVVVPTNAKLQLQRFQKTVAPLDWVPVVDVPTGSGVFFMHTISVTSPNLNFLEGCYHQYTPYKQAFPGTVLSTGTEDYFDSAWYFNAGEFRLPVSGLTHLVNANNRWEFSAYRFHDTDPLPFENGFLLHWRNGDMVDASGRKCFIQTGGSVVGNPGYSNVTIYGWVYTW